MTNLGRLSRCDPREVWGREDRDFTPWLAEHLDELGAVLGFELEAVERESAVGDFWIDILARDLNRDRMVVIENQLEPTDHSHLGQLITYAAGVEAGAVIWVSREFREEHRQALDWLNRGHGAETDFFGVIVEVLKIDDSPPAVNFRPVAVPNDWYRKSSVRAAGGEISGKRLAYQQFFQQLIDELREKHRFTNARAGQPQNWYAFSTGVSGLSYVVNFGAGARLRAEVYIDIGDEELNARALEQLRTDASELQNHFEEPLAWEKLEGKRACRVACYLDQASITDSDDDKARYLAWVIDRLLLFKKVFGPRLPDLIG
jgi:hypothetical protein